MKRICQAILLLLLATTLFQCRKEPGFIGEPDPTPLVITPDPVTTNLQGNIVDENDLPAAGVNITAGNQTVVTDVKGYFRMNNAVLDKKNTLVTASKAGYFKGLRLFAATRGTNLIKIKLIKKELAGTIASGTGGNVTLSNGSNISLPANGIVVAATNSNYSGTVNVYAQYIDPSANDIAAVVPGSFAGYDKDGRKAILTSYGMLAVELESDAGEKLQIKDNNTATLVTPIPAGAVASAPASVPLWYIDEKTGLWREEGTGTKQGNNYTGTVKHFSFWNFDGSIPAANLTMRLVNENNSPIQYAAVRMRHPSNPGLSTNVAFTDSLGVVSGIVPINEDLLIQVLEPCNDVVTYSQNIAQITQDTDFGDVTISSNIAVVTVKGQLLNCVNQPVTNGFATIMHGYTTLLATTDVTGHYEATFVMCTSASPIPMVDVMGTDNTNPLHNAYQSVFLTNATTIPNIVVCNETGYIHYNVDGIDYTLEERNDGNEDVYARIGDAGQGPIVMVYGTSMTPFRQMTMNMGGTTVGTYPVGFVNSFYATEALPASGGYDIRFGNASRSSLTVIANNNGEYYEGSMNVTYTYSLDNYATGHSMDCTFRAKRRD